MHSNTHVHEQTHTRVCNEAPNEISHIFNFFCEVHVKANDWLFCQYVLPYFRRLSDRLLFKIQCLPSGVVPMNYFTKDELVVHADFTETQEKRVYPRRSSTYKRESTAQRDARRLERLPSNPQWDHKGDKCI